MPSGRDPAAGSRPWRSPACEGEESQAGNRFSKDHVVSERAAQPNAPRLSCAAHASGRDDMTQRRAAVLDALARVGPGRKPILF